MMNADLVLIVAANLKPDNPAAISCFIAISASAADAEQLVKDQVSLSKKAIRARRLFAE